MTAHGAVTDGTDITSRDRRAMDRITLPPINAHDIPSARRHLGTTLAIAAVAVVSVCAAACGTSSSTPTATAAATATAKAVVDPPDLTLQGCNYEIDGTVPAGMSQGIQPPFPSFVPDQAALDALDHIAVHGGSGLVTGFTIPAGTELYAGPDATQSPVATISSGRSILVAEPVLWTGAGGRLWLATFVACGGPHLYWIDVAQIQKVDHDAWTQITDSITTARQTSPTAAGQERILPVVITAKHQFAWGTDAVDFAIGRGEYQGF